jgi:hypothetical protein
MKTMSNSKIRNIAHNIQKANRNYMKNNEWQSIDAALRAICGGLKNKTVQTVLPKIVAIDRLYRADIIRYLPKPKKGDYDLRPTIYNKLANKVVLLYLDQDFANLRSKSDRLIIDLMPIAVEIHSKLSETVTEITGRSGDVFASKYLHFCSPLHFPILDQFAEEHLFEILSIEITKGKYLLDSRFGFDEASGRYNRFCRAMLALQAVTVAFGFGCFTFSELDRYLYGDFKL